MKSPTSVSQWGFSLSRPKPRQRVKVRATKEGLGRSARGLSALLADTSERPKVAPVAVVAAHVHVPLVAPPVERGVAPVAILVLPDGGVRMLVSEGGISLVVGRKRVRINGGEPMELVLAGALVVVDDAPLVRLGAGP